MDGINLSTPQSLLEKLQKIHSQQSHPGPQMERATENKFTVMGIGSHVHDYTRASTRPSSTNNNNNNNKNKNYVNHDLQHCKVRHCVCKLNSVFKEWKLDHALNSSLEYLTSFRSTRQDYYRRVCWNQYTSEERSDHRRSSAQSGIVSLAPCIAGVYQLL
jgi:hypothetical protein